MNRSLGALIVAGFGAAAIGIAAPAAQAAPTFTSCKQAKAAGYCDIQQGDPGYSDELDRDGDGVACEC